MIALIIMFDWLPNLKFFLDVATITRPALITMFGWLPKKTCTCDVLIVLIDCYNDNQQPGSDNHVWLAFKLPNFKVFNRLLQ